MEGLKEAAQNVAIKTLKRTRVFNDRRFTSFRNEVFNEWMREPNPKPMRWYMGQVQGDFDTYASICRDVFDAVKEKRT